MIIKTWRDPYDAGFTPTRPKEIELKTGLTVLVGCNGAGKSTLLLNIKESCKNNNIPCLSYDNLTDGGSNALSSVFFDGDYIEGAYLWSSSEGECIKANLGRKTKLFQEFISKGIVNDRSYKLAKIFSDEEDEEVKSNDRVFLFDAVDSGLSVDSIVEVKGLFDTIIDDFKESDKNIYIVIAANEYELARNSECFDVNTGKYIRFNDYEDYRTFILRSRKRKEDRIEKQTAWRERQKRKEIKEYLKTKEIQKQKLESFRVRELNGETVSFWDKRDAENMDKDFLGNARFISKNDVEELEKLESEELKDGDTVPEHIDLSLLENT